MKLFFIVDASTIHLSDDTFRWWWCSTFCFCFAVFFCLEGIFIEVLKCTTNAARQSRGRLNRWTVEGRRNSVKRVKCIYLPTKKSEVKATPRHENRENERTEAINDSEGIRKYSRSDAVASRLAQHLNLSPRFKLVEFIEIIKISKSGWNDENRPGHILLLINKENRVKVLHNNNNNKSIWQ